MRKNVIIEPPILEAESSKIPLKMLANIEKAIQPKAKDFCPDCICPLCPHISLCNLLAAVKEYIGEYVELNYKPEPPQTQSQNQAD